MSSYEERMAAERQQRQAAERAKVKSLITKVVGGVVSLIVLVVVLGSFYTVDEGERGVVIRTGEVTGVATPGLHWKLPILDRVQHISTREHVALYSNMEAYSRDQQPATMTVSVTYRVDASRVAEVYSSFGDRQGLVDRQITRRVMEDVKTVFGTFNAESSIRERARLNAEIVDRIRSTVTGPVFIVGVQVEDVSFSKAYENSVEQRMLAEVAVQRENQNLERERVLANIVRTQAEAEADRVRFAAQAEADAIRMRGEAEASAIRERAEALAENENLVELVKAERWDGKLPTTMLPNSTVPFIEANKQ